MMDLKKQMTNGIERIAVLSNVNMNFVIRMLQKDYEVYETEGYGNELGILMNPGSTYHGFAPQITFMVLDMMELIEHDIELVSAEAKMESWFSQFGVALANRTDKAGIFYVSDGYLWGVELGVVHDVGRKHALEHIWQEKLENFCTAHTNVRVLPFRSMIEKIGEDNAFSMKMWYMGKILLSNQAQKDLCALMEEKIRLEQTTPKKVLLLDLDNTLWGGLAGEADHTPIVLSEDHSGLAYKNLQRVILKMKEQGVLLGIVSKNNEADVQEILENHPHQVLREECFAIRKINWKAKHENIQEIAEELNMGLDSFVFFDDNPTERQLIKEMLPQVEVPDFPDKPEELAPVMVEIYRKYFAKTTVTAEDIQKTEQYAASVLRNELQNTAGSYEEYLRQLLICMERVDASAQVERLTQLVNKTNQFNLTTKRYTQGEIQEVLADPGKLVYLYRVEDRFGDNGVVAVVIVECLDDVATSAGESIAVIEEFAMSCRVMGKNIEDAILDQVEEDLQRRGVKRLRGIYLPTAKNKPVEDLYAQLGYEKIQELPEGGVVYELELAEKPYRSYVVEVVG
ncbi:MAG: HAD-IIIC family phosphatase [Lachnospiraceae bacterium]|nr:HAD-IIIC family phosphatase [Lachnospiraceae bacterium]